ncbi:hypothetical protein GCM10023144_45860 [Pigmentiphaga soli]|uniref:Type II secretion system protein I n=1 Tax=Pigmentiphaga soli TaxID=1007095 RepID=A0ABP8HRG5_9BURK
MRCNDALPARRRPVHARRCGARPARERGFTLVEVLVALAIVGIALAAAVRAAGMIAQNNAALRARSLALVAAENQLAELRLQRVMPGAGVQRAPCNQGRLQMVCEEVFTNSPNGSIRQVAIVVHPAADPDRTLVRLNGFLTALP